MEEQSILEIAKKANLDWATTQKWLEALTSMGMVIETSKGNRRLFRLPDTVDQKTLFGIPVKTDDANTIRYIYSTTRKLWKEKTGEYPSRSHVQKVLAQVNKDLNLSLPIGWYLYGEVCILPYDSDIEYNFVNFEKKDIVKVSVEKAVNELLPLKSTRKLRNYLYEKNHNELYLHKEKVSYMRYGSPTFESIETLIHLLLEMIPFLPKNRETTQLFTEYIGVLLDVKKSFSNKMDHEQSMKIWSFIFNSFDVLWSIIAIESLRETLLETKKYPAEMLEARLSPRLVEQQDSFITLVQQLSEVSELEKMYEMNESDLTPEMRKLRKIKGSVKHVEHKGEADEKEVSESLRKLGFD